MSLFLSSAKYNQLHCGSHSSLVQECRFYLVETAFMTVTFFGDSGVIIWFSSLNIRTFFQGGTPSHGSLDHCWQSGIWGRHINTREAPQQLGVLDVKQASEKLKQHSDKAWKYLWCLTTHEFSLSLFTSLPDMDESALCSFLESFWGLKSTMLLSC